MKLIIDIDEEVIEHAKGHSEDSNDEYSAMRSIENGILLDDFLKRRKEPIDESVVESYLKENEQ